ncbi:MAG: hypothetical protein AB1711_08405 [Thermodesulfobacteriota bacterium]|nr:hypothetical protein [Desulfovibrionales bacterium]
MKTEELKDKIRAAAVNNRIACAVACKLAEETGVSPVEVGRLIDELNIKIVQCQLGCF